MMKVKRNRFTFTNFNGDLCINGIFLEIWQKGARKVPE
jgi:hypothetical protein